MNNARRKRLPVPPTTVRSAETILAGATVIGDYVWTACWNCGGTGRYPSSMLPPGMCRLYCWKDRTPETYGKLATPTDRYVKKQQAADRATYRQSVQYQAAAVAREDKWQAERPAILARAEAEAQAEREARDADASRLAHSQWVGVVGQRLTLSVRVTDVRKFDDGSFGPRFMVRMRDDSGNVLVWWTGAPLARDFSGPVRLTVKDHNIHLGEHQTVVTRVGEARPEGGAK